jgi:hypothetical protein
MEVFPYRRQVMRLAIAHIGHGPDDRDPFVQPPPYGFAPLPSQPPTANQFSSNSATGCRPEIQGLPDGGSAVRGAKFGPRPEKAMNMPISHIGLMYRTLGWGIVIGAARRRF